MKCLSHYSTKVTYDKNVLDFSHMILIASGLASCQPPLGTKCGVEVAKWSYVQSCIWTTCTCTPNIILKSTTEKMEKCFQLTGCFHPTNLSSLASSEGPPLQSITHTGTHINTQCENARMRAHIHTPCENTHTYIMWTYKQHSPLPYCSTLARWRVFFLRDEQSHSQNTENSTKKS